MKEGFTLIELLVVVLIIGILAAIALPQYQKAVTKSRFAEALANLKVLADAHQACFMANGDYCSKEDLDVDVADSEHFTYTILFPNQVDGWAKAQYRDEDVCLCYSFDDEIVLSQNESGCEDEAKKFDYGKLLKLRKVDYDGCGCC